MRCGKYQLLQVNYSKTPSQPARMRCGKSTYDFIGDSISGRNPHECAVANFKFVGELNRKHVATRTNALWQMLPHVIAADLCKSQPARMRCGKANFPNIVKKAISSQPARMRCGKACLRARAGCTRSSQPARMRCGKESAVEYKKQSAMSQPARMRCGKVAIDKLGFAVERRNPHECAVAKPTEQKSNTNLRVATRTNALWQN